VDIGDLALSDTTSGFDINGIFILPKYQNRGIGSLIISDLVEEAWRRGEVIGLQVFKTNPAQALYKRLGFEFTGETDTHYLMQKHP
jgi:ribosomal protein S18 acetylase RimI-like enzyme